MKTRIMTIALALASGITLAQAQDAQQGGPNADGKKPGMARMQQELGLTDEQLKQMREIRQNGGTREEAQAVLTPEQQAKAAELKKTHQGKGATRMKKKLGLSDEQVAQVKEIQEAGGSREEIRAVLTPEQQAKFDKMRDRSREKAATSEE